MSTDYKENRTKLADKIKNVPSKLHIQEVRPVEEKKTKQEESHVNFWMPSDLMEEIKILSVKQKKTLKQIGIEAFKDFIVKNKI